MRTTTLRPLAIAGAAALALTACGNTVTKNSAAGPTLPATDTSATATTSASPTGPKTNDRGNIVKALGEEGGVTNPAGEQLLTFAIDAITVDPPCTPDWEDYGTPVDPGRHLVSVQTRISTSPAVTDSDFLTLSGYDFRLIGADGITVGSLDSAATYGCLEDAQEFTSDTLGPGQMYVGAIILDVPAANGTLVLDPSWGQTGGWEYNF
jgi:hypothetical protein